MKTKNNKKILVVSIVLFIIFLLGGSQVARAEDTAKCTCTQADGGTNEEEGIELTESSLNSVINSCFTGSKKATLVCNAGAKGTFTATSKSQAQASIRALLPKEAEAGGTGSSGGGLPSIVPEKCRGDADIADCNLTAVEETAVNVATIILGIAGGLALVMFVYGGFMYILAGGVQSMVEKGKSALTYATIGLVIIMGAQLIIKSLLKALVGRF